MENYGLNCNAPNAVSRNNGKKSTQSMSPSGANAFIAHSAKSNGKSGDGRPNRFARGSGGASGGSGASGSGGGGASGGKGGGPKLTADLRAASRERSKERRAQTVALIMDDPTNLMRYDEAAQATDPSNDFKQLKTCAQKINAEFKRLNKKAYGRKFLCGPFKRKNDNDPNDNEVS